MGPSERGRLDLERAAWREIGTAPRSGKAARLPRWNSRCRSARKLSTSVDVTTAAPGHRTLATGSIVKIRSSATRCITWWSPATPAIASRPTYSVTTRCLRSAAWCKSGERKAVGRIRNVRMGGRFGGRPIKGNLRREIEEWNERWLSASGAATPDGGAGWVKEGERLVYGQAPGAGVLGHT